MIRAMTLRFDSRALVTAMSIFAMLVSLAVFGAHAGWLRSFFGVGCALESMQYLVGLWHVRIGNPVLRIVLGSTPDWMDVLAYALGFVAVLTVERALRAGRPTASAP